MEETKSSRIVTFHWLCYGSLPLAELLLSKEKFLLPDEVVMQYQFLLEMQDTSPLVGVSSMHSLTDAFTDRVLSFGLLNIL